ncbi:MAG TPA: condensation domain-containing protein, partial [Thermoanaerobaculia bacterium]
MREVVVLAREDRPGERRLVAYVVGRTGSEPEAGSLRTSLASKLPQHMVPSVFVLLEALPLTANGKVDRAALPAPEERDYRRARYVPPRTELERLLCEIWEVLLGIERVGIADSFFDLGGHSLLAMRVVSWVRSVLQREIPLRALFEHPTIEGLCETLGELRGGWVLPAIEALERRERLPLSYAQQRLWFIDRLEGGSSHYNIARVARVRGPLDKKAFGAAMRTIVGRHESLRTVFQKVDGVVVQVIRSGVALRVAESVGALRGRRGGAGGAAGPPARGVPGGFSVRAESDSTCHSRDARGHSLLLVAVQNSIREHLQAGEPAAHPLLTPILPLSRDRSELPLSPMQERLWLVHQIEPESPAYNLSVSMRLTGRLHPGLLEGALAEIVRRHAALRTTFRSVEGRSMQVIGPAAPEGAGGFDLACVDLGDLAASRREPELRRLAAAESWRPFDLERDTPLRILLLRLGAEEWGMFLTIHHILSDGWSINVLAREISILYQDFSRGEASSLPELPIQYADYAIWQREWLSEEVLVRQTAYWRGTLAEVPPVLELPYDRPRPRVLAPQGANRTLDLPAAFAESLRELARSQGATLGMLLLTAWQALLSRWSGA